jgi:hypothetical protein
MALGQCKRVPVIWGREARLRPIDSQLARASGQRGSKAGEMERRAATPTAKEGAGVGSAVFVEGLREWIRQA